MASLTSEGMETDTEDQASKVQDEKERDKEEEEKEEEEEEVVEEEEEEEEDSSEEEYDEDDELDVQEFLRFVEELRRDVLKQWLRYRSWEQKCSISKEDPKIGEYKEAFIHEKLKYEKQKKELEEFSKENGLKIPCNGTYLYYRVMLTKFTDVVKPEYSPRVDELLHEGCTLV